MNNAPEKPKIITEGKNRPPTKPGDVPSQKKSGYNPIPAGERPVKPVITPAPPPKKKG